MTDLNSIEAIERVRMNAGAMDVDTIRGGASDAAPFAPACAAKGKWRAGIAIRRSAHKSVLPVRAASGSAQVCRLLSFQRAGGSHDGGPRERRHMKGMKPWRTVGMIVAAVAAMHGLARADVTGSHDGQLVAKKIAQPIQAAAAFSQSGSVVTGTLAIGGDPGAGGGAYLVTGRATPKRIKVKGSVNGVTVSWRAKIAGETLQGRARLKGAGVKLAGTLTLTRNPSLGDGTGCDGIFTSNQTFFTDQVLGTALVSCTACHVPGGQADATRLHITMNDALATARSIAPFVNSASPGDSRILQKPLALVPHGGGQQLTAGSSEDQILRQWVDLIAAAACN